MLCWKVLYSTFDYFGLDFYSFALHLKTTLAMTYDAFTEIKTIHHLFQVTKICFISLR